MLGFNGGLIGKDRTTSLTGAVGVWTLNEQVRAQRSGLWPIVGVSDPDAISYITEVEVNDGNTLESGVKTAINAFVVGCKFDGIWDAIKASCILAGARTLEGALTPLVGTAPDNNNFVSGDYDRKTGLVGNAGDKYLNSNRNNNVDPQNSRHLSVYVSTAATSTAFGGDIGYYVAGQGSSYIGRNGGSMNVGLSDALSTIASASTVLGFRGVSRAASASFVYRANNTPVTVTQTSVGPANGNIEVFRGGASLEANSRLAFYSIGEDINLALLESRVTTLISEIAATIP